MSAFLHADAWSLLRRRRRDNNWAWNSLYEQVSRCGKPLGDAVGDPAPTVYVRQYESCHVKLDCTNTTEDGCVATIDMD